MVGKVAPVQLNVTTPAAAVTPAFNVTVNVLDAKAAEFPNADGDVNVQTGVAGHVKPDNTATILPESGISETIFAEMVTTTFAELATLLLNVTEPIEIVPIILGRVQLAEKSISSDAELCVLTKTSVLANCAAGNVAPVHWKVNTPGMKGAVPMSTLKTFDANDDTGSAIPAGDVNLHTGVAGQVKPVKVVRILPDAGIYEDVVPVIVTITPVEPPTLLLNVTAEPVIEPSIGGSVATIDESILMPVESFVKI